jgi:hypothetical protein
MRTAGLKLDQAPDLDIPLRFFLTAPLFAAAAGVLLLLGGPELLVSPWHPRTLALTHLVTLGALTMAMLGALYQLLPVVVGVVVPGNRWSRWLHPAFGLGVVGLAAGLWLSHRPLLAAGLVLLAASLVPLLVQQALCLLRRQAHGPSVQLLRLAVLAFAGAIVLGLVFGSGHAAGWWPLPRQQALPVHVFWSLGGWVGGLVAGVGLAVLPMFYIAPTASLVASRTILGALAAMLVTAGLAGASGRPLAWWVPWGCGAIALSAFTAAIGSMLRQRRRKVSDVSLRYWEGGLAALWLAVALAGLGIALPHPRWLLAFGVVYLAGFGLSVLSGMLYKIVPFLVWMHRFSPLAGKAPIPMMADLLPRRHAHRQQWLHTAAVALLLAAALGQQPWLVRLAGLAFAAAGGYLWWNLLRAVRFRAPQRTAAGAAPAATGGGLGRQAP